MDQQESTQVSFSLLSDQFSLLQKASILFSTCLMVGFMPVASGTWASLVAVGLYAFMVDLLWQQQFQVIIIVTLMGVFAIHQVQKAIGKRDDGRFVIDEVVGMWIGIASFPFEWFWLVLGFFVFRGLDIWKPYPTRHIDRNFHGAWGVMLDDVICGFYTLAILKVVEALLVYL